MHGPEIGADLISKGASMRRRIFPLVLLLLLAAAWSGGDRESRAAVRPVLQALVLPRLSLDCLSAIGQALRICGSPVPRAAAVCGLALVEVLHSCP
jgi:hypothetical protein